MLTLAQLLKHLPDARYAGTVAPATIAVAAVMADSRTVRPGSLFVAVSGGRDDGHRFIPAALAGGAVAVLGTMSRAELMASHTITAHTPYVQVANSRRSLALASAALHGFPGRRMSIVGITGTDGKTTSCTLLEAILAAATADGEAPDGRVGVITTVGARIKGQASDTGLHVTTPDAPEVQRFLAEMVDAHCRYAVVESTSHGLAQDRVYAVDFDVAGVTNITHEHLDFHGTRDAYVAAKARLFCALYATPPKQGIPRCAVLNADDAGSYGALMAALNEAAATHGFALPVRSYGIPGRSQTRLDVAARDIRYAADRTRFDLNWWGGVFPMETTLIGEFNVYNILCAATCALALGVAPAAIQAGVGGMPGVIGRMERIGEGQPFLAVVDFAHTPVSLERALETLRSLVGMGAPGGQGRLIAVFGAAGLRDRAKRYLMGRVSGQLADFTVITAEDPRTEDLDEICREIARGVHEVADTSKFVIVPDRTAAIQYAVDMAQVGDVVGAFGKGHERSLCFGATEHPWSDQEAMRAALERRMMREA